MFPQFPYFLTTYSPKKSLMLFLDHYPDLVLLSTSGNTKMNLPNNQYKRMSVSGNEPNRRQNSAQMRNS